MCLLCVTMCSRNIIQKFAFMLHVHLFGQVLYEKIQIKNVTVIPIYKVFMEGFTTK